MEISKILAALIAIVSIALIRAPTANTDPGIFTQAEARYLEQLAGQGILPQTLGLHNGRDEVGLCQGVCLALNDHSAEVVDAGFKRHFPNLTGASPVSCTPHSV